MPPVPRRPPARDPRSPRRALLLLLIVPVVLLLGAVVVVRAGHDGEVLPGTTVDGLDLAGMTQDEAAAELTARADRPVLLTGAGQRITVRLRDAGLALDARATAAEALDAGRDGVAGGVLSTLAGIVRDREVDPVVREDRRKLDKLLGTVAARLGRRADDGGIAVDPASLEVSVKPSRAGRSVQRAALERELRAIARDATAPRTVAVPLKTLPPAPREQVEEVAADAEEYLATSLDVTAGTRSASVSPRQLATILRMEAADGQVRLGADPAATKAVVTGLKERLDRPARPPRFSVSPGSASLTAKGDASWRRRRADVSVSGGREGRVVDADKAALALRRAIRDLRHDAALPTRTETSGVSLDAAREVDWLIGTFTTPFEPGQPRVTNIRRIAAAVDGTVVPPGGQFSLNGISGQRTEAKGYVEAPFIADGKIVPSVGGGVSQFSTTIYNAAYFAGLQLDSSQPHSLYIDRYPPGREATLNFPDIDLRWTNDTDVPVVVRTRTGPASVTVWLYGDNGGRRVRAITGERSAVPGRDFSITVTREVRYPDGRTVRQPRTTTYDQPVE